MVRAHGASERVPGRGENKRSPLRSGIPPAAKPDGFSRGFGLGRDLPRFVCLPVYGSTVYDLTFQVIGLGPLRSRKGSERSAPVAGWEARKDLRAGARTKRPHCRGLQAGAADKVMDLSPSCARRADWLCHSLLRFGQRPKSGRPRSAQRMPPGVLPLRQDSEALFRTMTASIMPRSSDRGLPARKRLAVKETRRLCRAARLVLRFGGRISPS